MPGVRITRIGIDRHAQIRGHRIVGEFHVDEEPVATDEPVAAVERAIRRDLHRLHQTGHSLGPDVRTRADVDTNRGNRERPA
ncbi:hypothetical protein FMUAM8_09170 [Nocardia cyriacigeorgica]|nr:hypothetical protein FMUAM8_09170 [Nocardia cyriacigeorgica]